VKATEERQKTAAAVKTAGETAAAFTDVREVCNPVFASNNKFILIFNSRRSLFSK
jgi:hypothetical protein